LSAANIRALPVAADGRTDPSAQIVAVDRRPLVRLGLARLAGNALACRVEAVADLAEAAAVFRASDAPPRAVLLGTARNEDPGLLVTGAMRFGVPVICAVDNEEDDVLPAAIAAGARACLVIGQASAESLRATMSRIEAGEPATALAGGPASHARAGRGAPVTERSLEVLGSLADGLHDHEIGVRLGISTSSVRKHIASAQTRLRARTRTQAVAMATREGLL
jgi:DNA-binding NarL/FixJ family response regulator